MGDKNKNDNTTEAFTSLKEKATEVFESGKENFNHISQGIHEALEDNSYSHSFYYILPYIPIVGPLFSYILNRKKETIFTHTKNAFYLQSTFIIILFTIWLLENLPVISHVLKMILFVPNMTSAIIYLNWSFLIVLSVMSARKAIRKEKWIMPFLYNFWENLLKKK